MKKLIGKTISVGKKINHIDIKWYTFKNGEVVPTNFEHDIIAKSGKLEEVKVLESKPVEKVTVEKKTTKKTTKKSKK